MNNERTYIVKCVHCSHPLDAVVTFDPKGLSVTVMVYWHHECKGFAIKGEDHVPIPDDRD